MGTIYLAKANDRVISHCRCGNGLITWPPQMDCPWCGCGPARLVTLAVVATALMWFGYAALVLRETGGEIVVADGKLTLTQRGAGSHNARGGGRST